MSVSAPMTARLADAQVRYLSRLAESTTRLGALLSAHEQTGDEASLVELRHLVHRLAGAAGSFGFGEIGTLAERADVEAKRLLAEQGNPARLHALTADLLVLMRATQDA